MTTTPTTVWTGRILSALAVLLFLFSASLKFSGSPEVVGMFTGKFGYPPATLLIFGILEVSCVVVYLIPRTAILGATLLTGYLGGAIATHVRVGDPFVVPLVLGIVVWAGLYLRDERVRSILPLRQAF
jgi:DoxX-like family